MPGLDPIRVHALVDSLSVGGAQMLLAEFAAVRDLVAVDLSVGYLADSFGSPAADRLRQLGIEPALIPVSRIGPAAVRATRRQIAARAPELVHTHLGYADLIGGVAARSLSVPTVSTIHAVEWDQSTPRDRIKTRLMALARRRCAVRILAVSESARRAYLDAGWDTPARVRTVHSGIHRKPRPGTGPAIRAELGLRPETLVLSMLSQLRPEKGHAVALETVERLRERLPGARLIVAGDGPMASEVARMAAPLGDSVVLAGYRDDVMQLLDATDILIQPSTTEALPTAVLEAMSASVPVIATAVGGIPEIVEHGQTGILIDPPPRPERFAAAVLALADDPGTRRRLAAGGRLRFESEFSAEAWAVRVREQYDAVLAMHR